MDYAEEFRSCVDTQLIAVFLGNGIRKGDDRLVAAALEELLYRGETDLIAEELDYAFESEYMTKKTVSIIGESLSKARDKDRLLGLYGQKLLNGLFESPHKWVKDNAKQFRKLPPTKAVEEAKPWASSILFGGPDSILADYD